MGRASNDILLRGFFEYAVHHLRNNQWLLTDVFGDTDVVNDPLTKVEVGDRDYKNAIDWFNKNKISTVLHLRRDRPTFPCISIALSSSQEQTALTSLGDQDHMEDFDPQTVTSNPDKIIKNFTPKAYDKASGTITMPDGLTTYQVAALLHMVVESQTNRGFQILKIVDDARFQIKADAELDLKGIYIAPITAAWNVHYNRTRFLDNYEIGVHASSDPVECIWMGQLVEYILLRYKQKFLQERNIQLSTFTVSNVSKNENYPADNVYSRFFHVNFQSEMQWIEAVYPKIAKTTGGIKIISGPETPEALQEQMSKQFWHMEEDDIDNGGGE
jgi:hypothetical protein